jgi:hypothetical protein
VIADLVSSSLSLSLSPRHLHSLFSSLVVIPLFKFKIPRFYSFYLMVVYCGYMLFSGLVVADVLHILPSGN